jgi:DNA-binding CsgD family transcriptional regulator
MTALLPKAFATHGAMGLHVMAAMAHSGTSRLSGREVEGARPILQGHSSNAIARMLGNNPETVKVFRTCIHTKLGLVTSVKLFPLFPSALCPVRLK